MTASRSLAGLPLPVGIFRAAMQRQQPLNTYAATLDLSGDELRALIAAQAEQVAPETLARVAAAHGLRADEGQLALAPTLAEEPFSAWLERQMEGVTQASLRARTQLAAPQLRAFLSGKVLPDADEAERLARALYVDRNEMAHSIVADMTRRARGGSAASAAPTRSPRNRTQEPESSTSSVAPAAPARSRRSRRPVADAAPAAQTSAPEPEPQADAAALPPDQAPARATAPAPVAAAPVVPDETASAAMGQPATTLRLAAHVAPTTALLQLSPEEARLIRLWRRLHPQGRRATLHYIGTLLVEEEGDQATA